MRIVFVANTFRYLYNFRLNTALALIDKGYEVVFVSAKNSERNIIFCEKIEHETWKLNAGGTNPFVEIMSIINLFHIIRKVKADVVLSFTPKGNIYSGIVCRLMRVPSINNISGLGVVFTKNNLLTTLIRHLYRFSLDKAFKVFFQNNEDKLYFIEKEIVKESQATRLPGSGVDLSRFSPSKKDKSKSGDGQIVFLLVSRMLKEKGIVEYAQAAKRTKEKFNNVEFQILGFIPQNNPSAIRKEQIKNWENDGLLVYLGESYDVPSIIANSDCVVLPSYYKEGVPRVLLEAASMEKPVITTDMPGCRDAVDDNITGFLCKPRDENDLLAKIIKFLELSDEERKIMGNKGRQKVEDQFDEKLVIMQYLGVINQIQP